MSLLQSLSAYWLHLQGELLPELEDWTGGRLSPSHSRLVSILVFIRVEAFLPSWPGLPGRPPAERAALARAFIAKAVFNLATTRLLIDMLCGDRTLRRLCGFQRLSEVPSEATFSRGFAAFAASGLPSRLHEALIIATHAERLVGHISRDSTAIEAREKPVKLAPPTPEPARKRGRPRKGMVAPPRPPRRIERQRGMSLQAMLDDLPRHCDVGTKRNAKGHQEHWIGYKLHIDSADGDIPVACVLTAASVHDSQVAIPLATMTAGRVTSLYDLMDSAYDVAEIKDHSRALGHVPIIDTNPRHTAGLKQDLATEAKARRLLGHTTAEQVRYRERSTAERVNSALKDSYGGRMVRVRGGAKVMCHLMFGVLSLTVVQLLRLLT